SAAREGRSAVCRDRRWPRSAGRTALAVPLTYGCAGRHLDPMSSHVRLFRMAVRVADFRRGVPALDQSLPLGRADLNKAHPEISFRQPSGGSDMKTFAGAI